MKVSDVDEKEAEYLLIAENVERRGQAETDPIKKSRIANFLKEYWGVQQGSRSDLSQNGTSKGFKDISNIINESRTGTHRILKLNDLIPELQELVSQGKLGTTAGEQLAHMTENNQHSIRQNGGSIKTLEELTKSQETLIVNSLDMDIKIFEADCEEEVINVIHAYRGTLTSLYMVILQKYERLKEIEEKSVGKRNLLSKITNLLGSGNE